MSLVERLDVPFEKSWGTLKRTGAFSAYVKALTRHVDLGSEDGYAVLPSLLSARFRAWKASGAVVDAERSSIPCSVEEDKAFNERIDEIAREAGRLFGGVGSTSLATKDDKVGTRRILFYNYLETVALWAAGDVERIPHLLHNVHRVCLSGTPLQAEQTIEKDEL